MDKIHGFILAAGFGTRLGQLSEIKPKPLLPVANQPLLRWVASLLADFGVSSLQINTHHQEDLFQKDEGALGTRFQIKKNSDIPIHYWHEREILGTGGGAKRMAMELKPTNTTIVINGKIITNINLKALYREHKRRKALATLVLIPHPHAKNWNAVHLNASGQISSLLDFTRPNDTPTDEGYIFSGIHFLEPEFFDYLPLNRFSCLIRDGHIPLLRKNAPIYGAVHRGYFYDHSTPARYLQGNFNILDHPHNFSYLNEPLTGVSSSAKISPTAIIKHPVLIGDDVKIDDHAQIGPYVIVGNHAHIKAYTNISESLVWPQVELDERCELRHVIATQKDIVHVEDLAEANIRP